jgi:uncharacterized membrane protein
MSERFQNLARAVRIDSVGHALFAAIVIALGIVGLVEGEFSPVWQPVPKGVPAHEILVYACAMISLAAGIGLLCRRIAAVAACVLLVQLTIWLLVFRVSALVRAPAAFEAWDGCAETAVMVAGARVLYAWFAGGGFAGGDRGLRIARVLYGLALIPFGLGHFVYIDQTAAMVPDWLPVHVAWAYFTGGAFLAAGAAILVGVFARQAAALSTLQIGLFTLLVWVPIVAAGSTTADQRSEFGLSSALTASAWVVAESYRIRTRTAA